MKKTAVVTGGSRGIGYAVAKQLGLDGCQVVIFSLEKPEDCQEALEKLTELEIDWHYVQGSIDSQEGRERLVKEAGERARQERLMREQTGEQCRRGAQGEKGSSGYDPGKL